MGKISRSMPKSCGSLKTVAQFSSSQDLWTCWWIHFLGTSAGDYHPTHRSIRTSRGSDCLPFGGIQNALTVLSPQVSTKVRGYDKSIHKSNHTPISSTTSTGAGDFQAHFPSSFSGAGTGAAFWLLAGPPSVFRVQVWIEEPAAYNYKWPLNIPNSIGFSCFHRQVIQDTTAKIMSKRVADQEAEGCHSKC